MRVVTVDGLIARCAAQGSERDVSLFMLQGELIEAGDFVMVHSGYAIEKMTSQQAQTTWALLEQVLGAEDLA